jgi:hypothetical protein
MSDEVVEVVVGDLDPSGSQLAELIFETKVLSAAWAASPEGKAALAKAARRPFGSSTGETKVGKRLQFYTDIAAACGKKSSA